MRNLKIMLLGVAALVCPAAVTVLYAQVDVAVNASTTVVTIPSEIFGINMACYNQSNNGSDPAYVSAMEVSGCRSIRWPGGSYSDIVNWDDLQSVGSYAATTPQFISFLQKFGGTMQAVVNFSGYWGGAQHTHAQAVSLAASWVSWNLANSGSARAKYWEIGNEDYGSWEQGNTNGTTYGQYFADYYNAMKAADPAILIGAVALSSASAYTNWTPDMLAAAKTAGVVPDFLAVHNYPESGTGIGAAVDASILNDAGMIAGQKTVLDGIVSSVLGGSYVGQVKYFMTEYNSSWAASAQVDQYINAMFVSQSILEMARSGWIGGNLWSAKNGGYPDYGFINTTTDAPYPDYYVFPMLAGKFGRSMVACTSSNSMVRAYAAMDSSGYLTLFIVNNDPANSNPATVTLSGFTPATYGAAWVMLPYGRSLSGAPQEAPQIQINGNVNPAPASLASILGVGQDTGPTFTVGLQPSEMFLAVIPPYGVAITTGPPAAAGGSPTAGATKKAFNYPNPFNPARGQSTNIVIDMAEDGNADITIYSEYGNRCWGGSFYGLRKGTNQVSYNGKDDSGNMMYNGAYPCIIRKKYQNGEQDDHCRLLIIK